MVEAKRRLILAWIAKAEDDLAVARLLISEEKRLLSAGVYHCQQGAEKMLKAWLTLHDIVFPRTHDLELLVDLGSAGQPNLAGFRHHARALTPLASEYRYPGDVDAPDLPQAKLVLQMAEEICASTSALVHAALARSSPDDARAASRQAGQRPDPEARG